MAKSATKVVKASKAVKDGPRILLLDIEFDGYRLQVTHAGEVTVFGKKGLPLTVYNNVSGYPSVKVNNATVALHRLVAMSIPNPHGLSDVNHIDGNKHNNHPSNLEWASRSDNLRHALASGLHANPETPVVAYKENGSGYWFKSQAVAKLFGFTQANISKCVNGVRPRHKGYTWEYANG